MDVEFVVQDAFSLVRPHWKIAKTLEEAGGAFADACKANYKNDIMNKAAEPDESEAMENDDIDGGRSPPGEDADTTDEDLDDEADDQPATPNGMASDEDEHIIVTRPEDERDPEAEAEFDRELAKMMSESIETRKSERPRQTFDVALPMRRGQQQKDSTSSIPVDDNEMDQGHLDTVKFSLLSKRGNRPQVSLFSHIHLPAVAAD